MNDPCVSRNRLILAIIAIAFGAGLMTMAGISAFYSWRLAAVHTAHRGEVTAQERRHSRDKTEMRKGISDKLDQLKGASCR